MEQAFDKVSKDQLMGDFKAVISDAEALLKQTVNQGGEELAGVRSRAESSLASMKARIVEEEAAVLAFSRDAAKSADVYVHLYPWTAVGVAAAVGLVVGLLSSRR